jgi:hypothetical protein
MPTPALHIPIAHEVAARLALREQLGAFLFGGAGPDVAHFLGRPRAETHFWTLSDDVSGALTLLRTHPSLEAAALSSFERHFMAGYLCHLVTDEQWTFCIWRPYFGRQSRFAGGAEGAALQSALRDALDVAAHAAAPSVLELARAFEQPVPLRDTLLPFVDGASIERYRVALLEYLGKGAPLSDTPLHREAIAYVRPESVQEFRERAVEESAKVVADYLAGRALRPPRGTEEPTERG